jgi:hypothetical protein
MLPIANTNGANWKLGIGIGNNGNISPRFVQPAKQAFSCTASGGFRVRRAVVPEGRRTSGARRTACRPGRCAATDANRRKAIDRDGGFRGRAQAHPTSSPVPQNLKIRDKGAGGGLNAALSREMRRIT